MSIRDNRYTGGKSARRDERDGADNEIEARVGDKPVKRAPQFARSCRPQSASAGQREQKSSEHFECALGTVIDETYVPADVAEMKKKSLLLAGRAERQDRDFMPLQQFAKQMIVPAARTEMRWIGRGVEDHENSHRTRSVALLCLMTSEYNPNKRSART